MEPKVIEVTDHFADLRQGHVPLRQSEFYTRCEALRLFFQKKTDWPRQWDERYNHGRCYEVSVWKGDSYEIGHVFYADLKWDGVIDEERVNEILAMPVKPIPFSTGSKVWVLSRLREQTEPIARCPNCAWQGQMPHESNQYTWTDQ